MAKKIEGKVWYQSKTLWFNAITFILGIISLAQTSPLFSDKAEVLGVFVTVQTAGNFVLRFLTDEPLTLKK